MTLAGLSFIRPLHLAAAGALTAGLIGCSDPVPPSAQGNFTITIANNPEPDTAPDGATCKAKQLNAGAGVPRPSTANPGGRLTDGEDGSRVECTVRQSDDKFILRGKIEQRATSFFVSSDDIDGNTGLGSAVTVVAAQGDQYEQSANSEYRCTLEVIKATEDGQKVPQVKSGAIWAKLDCPSMKGKQPTDYCRSSGVFVLENCDE